MKDLRYFDPHRRATWLELFFDLIFVVALHAAGEILIEAHEGHIGSQQPLWWIWAGHTIYANRFDTDSRQHRLSTLLIMFLLIVISAQSSAGAQEHYALAVACYCGARAIIAAMYFVSRRKPHIPHMLRRNNSQLPERVGAGQGVGGCTASMRRSVFSCSTVQGR
ncbi:low temperature requirement protein A [Variovorax sp. J22R133]|uniref:low temperature requirement protein A n=1 Tax=Variovorax brevis TaxID=3053503 RepID=UPI002578D29F|nr:low temperature requirement protein A [Variovorax sp. J22R133]MDM0116584.1 low temperature requirement protein A [Variovorax sp. J22R133]